MNLTHIQEGSTKERYSDNKNNLKMDLGTEKSNDNSNDSLNINIKENYDNEVVEKNVEILLCNDKENIENNLENDENNLENDENVLDNDDDENDENSNSTYKNLETQNIELQKQILEQNHALRKEKEKNKNLETMIEKTIDGKYNINVSMDQSCNTNR